MYDLLIIGGGAAGFFTAINTAEKHPNFKIAILKKAKKYSIKCAFQAEGVVTSPTLLLLPKNS